MVDDPARVTLRNSLECNGDVVILVINNPWQLEVSEGCTYGKLFCIFTMVKISNAQCSGCVVTADVLGRVT